MRSGTRLASKLLGGFVLLASPTVARTAGADPAIRLGPRSGVEHALTRWVGLRVDARYVRAFVDDPTKSGGYFVDYGYCRLAVGITFGGPAGAL